MRLFSIPGRGFLWNLLAPPFARLARTWPGPYFVQVGAVFVAGAESGEVFAH